MNEKGTISIHSENIFPIIKKFLYSDNEIFIRELVSNAVDAIQKIKHLASIGQYNEDLGELKVKVVIDKEKKTITVSDSGLGMTADEIKKYINQIAFSGATDFIEKFKNEEGDRNKIIGNFGLGFYSSYMVADLVEIHTKSYQNAPSAKWSCNGSTEFEIVEGTRAERGSDIILHISEEGSEFLDEFRLKTVLDKYCKFLPIEIEFDGKIINNPNPIWTKNPAELTDEDYIAFYKELYPFTPDPLFWIHLNVDYPFNLTGILYFPKLGSEFEMQKNKIHLFSRQVFITDDVKNIVPEFLMLLHGVIDSPDIPLNVSRSYLQADSNVRKINSHITKKVADKLVELFNKDRKSFEEKWEDISIFVKYGLISDDKFADKAEKICLLKNMENEYFTIEEYKEKISVNQKDKDDNTVLIYTSDRQTQDTYIDSAKQKGYDVLLLDAIIDNHFVNFLETKQEKLTIKRVDSDTSDKIIDKGEVLEIVLSDSEKEQIQKLFEKVVNNSANVVKVVPMSTSDMPVVLAVPEFMRRMKEMSRMNGMGMMGGNFPESVEISVNGNHALIQKILTADESAKEGLANHLYQLALLSQGELKGSKLTAFVKNSLGYLN